MKRNVNIKSMKYEDFNDNEYIEDMLKELPVAAQGQGPEIPRRAQQGYQREGV